jgi:predicted metal-dependent hydrolase
MQREIRFARPEGVKVTYRRMKFDFEDQGFERYWLGGSAFKSLFWTQLSTAFEPGEKFFIDSARALRSSIQDPELHEEISEFCKQEGHHTAQHVKFDKKNEELGIDVAGARRRYAFVLNRARTKLEPMEMLAVTCALEHFTASLADDLLESPRVFAGSDPKVTALFMWHAAEEAEHRATCYDLYRQLGGRYFQRTSFLFGAWTMILGLALFNTAVLLWNDKQLFTRDTLRGIAYLFGRRGIITGLGRAFFDYFKPRFHPWKGADPSTIARWQADNARYIQNLSVESAN